ncbi:FeoC-like transcriptional regulator [Xanthobacter sp. V4C-4]|uniref:FeoC-like transcriptional regulator n=1 Tax=Xanthobacter cornucopiae TaxID=3119924 RepID=UPI003727D526
MTTLSAVKAYMRDHHRTTVRDLAVGLSTTPDTARSLLEMWRAKDRVRFIPTSCGTCGKGPLGGCACPMASETPEIYEWVGDEDNTPHDP